MGHLVVYLWIKLNFCLLLIDESRKPTRHGFEITPKWIKPVTLMTTVPGYLPFYPVNYRPNPIYIQNRRPVPKKYGFRFPGKESEKVMEVKVEDMEETDLKETETSYKPSPNHVPAKNPAQKKYGFRFLRKQTEKEDSEEDSTSQGYL